MCTPSVAAWFRLASDKQNCGTYIEHHGNSNECCSAHSRQTLYLYVHSKRLRYVFDSHTVVSYTSSGGASWLSPLFPRAAFVCGSGTYRKQRLGMSIIVALVVYSHCSGGNRAKVVVFRDRQGTWSTVN